MANPLTLWCLLEGEIEPFKIKISGQEDIDELKTAIHAKCSNTLQGIDARQLDLYKPKGKIALEPLESIPERLPQDGQSLDRLSPVRRVSDYYPTLEFNALHVLVLVRCPNLNEGSIQLPQPQSPDGPAALQHGEALLMSIYRQCITFTIGSHDNLHWHEAGIGHACTPSNTPPTPIVDSRVPITIDVDAQLLLNCPSPPKSHSELSQIINVIGSQDPQPTASGSTLPIPNQDWSQNLQPTASSLYDSSHPEILHYHYAAMFVTMASKKLIRSAFSFDANFTCHQAYHTILDPFAAYWETHVENPTITFEMQFPFPLIAHERTTGRDYKYYPQPDALFSTNGFPCFLSEVDSQVNSDDCHQMTIQMVCVLRLKCAIEPQQNGKYKTFVVMGAFCSSQWLIKRFFFYNDEEGNILYHVKIFEMKKIPQLIEFLHEFHKFVWYVRDERVSLDTKSKLETLSSTISRDVSHSLSKPQQAGGSRNKRQRTQSNRGSGLGGNGTAAMTEALQRSGYVLRNDGFGPLDTLPAHVVEAISPTGKAVIAKLTRKDSGESLILQKLAMDTSPQNHVIPLLDTVQLRSTVVIILPQETPLSDNYISHLLHNQFNGEPTDLCHQLVEGVAFLHKQRIAHLDIKPSNLVYSRRSRRLYIIDFDLALECSGEEEVVEMSCGTRDWAAPEIVLDDSKPLRAFSPIRADLWSCGRVLKFICNNSTEQKDRDILKLSELLMDNKPRYRPLLHNIVLGQGFWTFSYLVMVVKLSQYTVVL